jgi:hypothetical protein
MRRACVTVAIGAMAALAVGCRCPQGAANGETSATASRAYAEGDAAAGAPAAAVLKQSAQCGGRSGDGRVRWLATAEELRDALAATSALTLSGEPRAAEPADVDFATSGVLHVEMGQRPTAGYALDLATGEVAVEDGTGVVRVNWTEPPEDGVVAQVLTSPCLLVTVRKAGLRKIDVVDQAGRVRGTVEVR